MKFHRVRIDSTGSNANYSVRIPSQFIHKGSVFVESLLIDSGATSTADINAIYVASNSFSDCKSYDNLSNNFNTLAVLANTLSVNTDKDFRYSAVINSSDIGFPVNNVNLSNLNLNIQLYKTPTTALDSGFTWNLTLLFVDNEEENNLVDSDPNQANYFGKVPIRKLVEPTINKPKNF